MAQDLHCGRLVEVVVHCHFDSFCISPMFEIPMHDLPTHVYPGRLCRLELKLQESKEERKLSGAEIFWGFVFETFFTAVSSFGKGASELTKNRTSGRRPDLAF